ncbi:hypothetical protein P7C73_g5298, partial [Tremellales sp. Uapishka_1]
MTSFPSNSLSPVLLLADYLPIVSAPQSHGLKNANLKSTYLINTLISHLSSTTKAVAPDNTHLRPPTPETAAPEIILSEPIDSGAEVASSSRARAKRGGKSRFNGRPLTGTTTSVLEPATASAMDVESPGDGTEKVEGTNTDASIGVADAEMSLPTPASTSAHYHSSHDIQSLSDPAGPSELEAIRAELQAMGETIRAREEYWEEKLRTVEDGWRKRFSVMEQGLEQWRRNLSADWIDKVTAFEVRLNKRFEDISSGGKGKEKEALHVLGSKRETAFQSESSRTHAPPIPLFSTAQPTDPNSRAPRVPISASQTAPHITLDQASPNVHPDRKRPASPYLSDSHTLIAEGDLSCYPLNKRARLSEAEREIASSTEAFEIAQELGRVRSEPRTPSPTKHGGSDLVPADALFGIQTPTPTSTPRGIFSHSRTPAPAAPAEPANPVNDPSFFANAPPPSLSAKKKHIPSLPFP